MTPGQCPRRHLARNTEPLGQREYLAGYRFHRRHRVARKQQGSRELIAEDLLRR
jgi:hypothetical protein